MVALVVVVPLVVVVARVVVVVVNRVVVVVVVVNRVVVVVVAGSGTFLQTTLNYNYKIIKIICLHIIYKNKIITSIIPIAYF